MGLEKIKQEILQKAEKAKKEILADASIKVEDLRRKTSDKIRQLEQEALSKLNAEAKLIENREQSHQNMNSQKMLFEAKKEIMDSVYSEAFEKIKKMSKSDREEIIKNLLDRSRKEIDVSAVYANSTDKGFIDSSTTLKPLETDGGIICETKDSSIRVDYTFTSIFDDLKEKTIKDASKILFG